MTSDPAACVIFGSDTSNFAQALSSFKYCCGKSKWNFATVRPGSGRLSTKRGREKN